MLEQVAGVARSFIPFLPTTDERGPTAPADVFRLTAIGAVLDDAPARYVAIIEAACRRPEIRPLSSPVAFRVDAQMSVPFCVRSGHEVVLNARSLTNPPAAAVHLRLALEIALLHRTLAFAERPFWYRVAAALLACRATACYFGSIVFLEQELARPHLSKDLLAALERFSGALPALPEVAASRTLRGLACSLLALQGDEARIDDDTWRDADHADAAALLDELAPLAAPTEVVIASGADARARLDPRTGLNNYGCCPRPRPWAVTFSSSTATSISDLAYQSAELLRADLVAAAGEQRLADAYAAQVEAIRSGFARVIGVTDPGTAVMLAGSGTDAELHALYLAMIDERPVVNVVVAPDETGRGVVSAAAGCHFSELTARGTSVPVGAAVAGFDTSRVRVATVGVRGEDGEQLDASQVDAQVERLVDQAVASGARVLLHVVDSAKTGLGAPGLALVDALCARHGDALDVVVDACQMRVEVAEMQAYLARGWLLLITGSKFFTGPPFSGALVVPPRFAARASALPLPPAALSDYSNAAEWPPQWPRQRAAVASWRNYGLLFRWRAALWEMQAFYAVEVAQRIATLRAFGERLRAGIERCPVTRFVPTPVFDRSRLGVPSAMVAPQTIFTFTVLRGAGGEPAPLSVSEAQSVYQWLNVDISHQLPMSASEAELALARRRFHIGQPVKLARRGDHFVGGLRISAGARLVSGVAFDATLGPTPGVRLEREIADALAILEKIALIVRHFDSLSSTILPPASDIAKLYEV
jgi:hypothetical protein